MKERDLTARPGKWLAIRQGFTLSLLIAKSFFRAIFMPMVWNLLLITSILFISQDACADTIISDTGAAFDEKDIQYKSTVNSNENILSSDNITIDIHNDTTSPISYPIEITPVSLELTNTASNSEACLGEEITYTIQICNLGSSTVTNVTVKDLINYEVKLISISPEPDESRLWHISRLEPGDCFIIKLTVRMPDYDAKFRATSEASGFGYINIHDYYAPNTISLLDDVYTLRNCVHVSANEVSDLSACADDVYVQTNAGVELKKREHGSGDYDSNDIVDITKPESGSIQYSTNLGCVPELL